MGNFCWTKLTTYLSSDVTTTEMVQRLTYRRRHCYKTRSNGIEKVKTPGGKLTIHVLKKKAQRPKCGDCGTCLSGIPAVRPKEMRHLKQRQRKVARAYGGSRCHQCVRKRIVRAFLIEEHKIVQHVLRQRTAAK